MKRASLYKYGLLMGCAGIVLANPANAVVGLTKRNIERFYDQSIAANKGTPRDMVAFYSKYLHEDAKISMRIKTTIDGQEMQEQKIVLNKEKALKQMGAGMNGAKINSFSFQLLSVDVAEDGKTAQANIASRLTFVGKYKDDETTFKGAEETTCKELLINHRRKIMVGESDCEVEYNLTSLPKTK